MPLDWDIKLDGVSIKSQIASFQVRETRSAYARELTLFAADPSFYDQFDYTLIPQLRVEVLTKTALDWVSAGEFYIERPIIAANPDGILSPGVWGRSKTAAAGTPFAEKISKTWTEDTTFADIIDEMADLCGLSIVSEIEDYTVFANSYACDGIYPINVIAQLADFAGGYPGCTAAGALVVRKDVFHPSVADYTITDDDIIDINEQTEYPDFGNRIRISAIGAGAGYQINLEVIDNDDCLNADGISKGTLLAFVTEPDGGAVPDNTIVTWTAEDGVSLEEEHTGTGAYLLENRKHRAGNYHSVDVEFPIAQVIGVWAYSDAGNLRNYWNPEYCSFAGTAITVHRAFDFCDQMLRVAYITAGCAVNRVTAGYTALDVEVTAEVEGARDIIEVKLGNTCDCGSTLNYKVNPYGSICLGNLAHILVWATINNRPATGRDVQLRITEGCGELSSENKKLKTKQILNETSYVSNNISGVSQVRTEIEPADKEAPKVYLATDTGKANDFYSSRDGKIIDLDTSLTTGDEVVIDYYADGATLVAWRTLNETKDCDSEVTIKMADGTEEGLREVANLSAKDCTVPDSIPDYNEDYSDYDPEYDDQSGDEGSDGFPDDGNDFNEEDDGVEDGDGGHAGWGGFYNSCDPASTIENRLTDDPDDGKRFDASSEEDCPPEGEDPGCSCEELCMNEVIITGNTQDQSQTLSEQAGEFFEEGSPGFYEAKNEFMNSNLEDCRQDCESAREAVCGECEYVSGTTVLAPGESAEFTCSDGATVTYTMPEGACGTQTIEVGCCTFEVRSTSGQWVLQISELGDQPPDGCPGVLGGCTYSELIEDPNKAGSKASGSIICMIPAFLPGNDCTMMQPVGGGGNCTTDCVAWGEHQGVPISFQYIVYKWEC